MTLAEQTAALLRQAGWQVQMVGGRIATNATDEAQRAALAGAAQMMAIEREQRTIQRKAPKPAAARRAKPKRAGKVTTIRRGRAAAAKLPRLRAKAIKAHGTKRPKASSIARQGRRLEQRHAQEERLGYDAFDRSPGYSTGKRKYGPGRTKTGRKRRPLTGAAKAAFVARMKASRKGR